MGIKTNRIEQTGTTSGLILPRVTNAEMLALPGDEGALCYNTDTMDTYQYQGTIWGPFIDNTTGVDGGTASG